MLIDFKKNRAPRNRTLTLASGEIGELESNLIIPSARQSVAEITDKTINQDIYKAVEFLPDCFVDLLFIDPPYNLTKQYNGTDFRAMESDEYEEWVGSWFSKILRLLKPTASVYVCCDWKSSNAIFNILSRFLTVRNRITWEREKGRGAKTNWKNCSEDIWFATVSNKYHFNSEAVKLKRKIIAPYRDPDGNPKDWSNEEDGKYRLTYPSNLWTDISIPYWSMPENTDHPTQKPEKLVAKIMLASSERGDFVLDPFLGSGTTSVVAKKLGRKYCGIEIDRTYCCLAEKRLRMVGENASIQGYHNSVFWERNSLSEQGIKNNKTVAASQQNIFQKLSGVA